MTWLLYSSPRSPFVRTVTMAAHELGLIDRIGLCDVMTTPMTPAPELLGDNPLSMIPTLMMDGEMVFDSRVILEVLDDHSEKASLFGQGDARRAVLQRLAMANGMTDKAVRILDEMFRTQNDDTEAHTAGFVASIRRGIAWMAPRLLADRFDAGDIAYLSLLSYLEFRFAGYRWLDGEPATAAWYDAQSKRPSFAATPFRAPPAP